MGTTKDKKPASTPKMADIMRPKRPAAASAPAVKVKTTSSAPQIIVHRRPPIDLMDESAETSASPQETTAKPPSQTAKRIVPITPLDMSEQPVSTKKTEDTEAMELEPVGQPEGTAEATPLQAAADAEISEASRETDPTDPKPQLINSRPTLQPKDPPAAPKAPTGRTEKAEPPADAVADDIAAAEEPTAKSGKHSDVHKALQEAQREKQIEDYIEKKEFYVPINAVARKRSIHVSILLTILELLLGLVLLNLMLDAGLIELMEKIPHTNFFNIN